MKIQLIQDYGAKRCRVRGEDVEDGTEHETEFRDRPTAEKFAAALKKSPRSMDGDIPLTCAGRFAWAHGFLAGDLTVPRAGKPEATENR